jgi:hypothetical protein
VKTIISEFYLPEPEEDLIQDISPPELLIGFVPLLKVYFLELGSYVIPPQSGEDK